MAKSVDHTFVVLSYNDSPFIGECIASLQKQTIKSEILIATSTLTDSVVDIAKKHHIDIIINSQSKGIGPDWSFAYDTVRTKYITLAHYDDVYFPQYTELCLKFAQKCKDNLITFTDYCELKNGELQKGSLILLIKKFILLPYFLFKKNLKSPFFKRLMLALGSPIACPSVMYNKENIGSFSFSEEFSINLDWDAWLRLAKRNGDFVYVKKRLMGHRIHEGSETTSGIYDQRRKNEDSELFNQIWPKPVSKLLLRLYSLSYKLNK